MVTRPAGCEIFWSANSYANDLPIPKSKTISTGQYQDGYVALKQLPEYYSTIGDRNSVTNSRFQIEIDQIRELCQIQHNHLARFFGIYKSIDLPTSIVTEYGTKGSLQDLLEDNGKNNSLSLGRLDFGPRLKNSIYSWYARFVTKTWSDLSDST